MSDPIVVDPNLKVLIEYNSNALAALLAKIASGDLNLTEEITRVSATDADVMSAIAGTLDAPAAESPESSAAPSD